MQRFFMAGLGCATGMGLLLAAMSASAACPGASYTYVSSNDQAIRHYDAPPSTPLWFVQDNGGNCGGSLSYYTYPNWWINNVTLSNFQYWGGGAYSWDGNDDITYWATDFSDGEMAVTYYDLWNNFYYFWANRTATPRSITIWNEETELTDVSLELTTNINGSPHFATQSLQDFTIGFSVGAILMNGTWNSGAGRWEGDFLYEESSFDDVDPFATLTRLDSRAFSDMYLAIWFTLGGNRYYDWEYIGDWNDGSAQSQALYLDTSGVGLSWDGSEYVGDFFHH